MLRLSAEGVALCNTAAAVCPCLVCEVWVSFSHFWYEVGRNFSESKLSFRCSNWPENFFRKPFGVGVRLNCRCIIKLPKACTRNVFKWTLYCKSLFNRFKLPCFPSFPRQTHRNWTPISNISNRSSLTHRLVSKQINDWLTPAPMRNPERYNVETNQLSQEDRATGLSNT